MKIGVIIPDRGDRPKFTEKCLEFISRQTLQPDFIELVNDKPKNKDVDVTLRYKLGYTRLSEKGADVIIFIENDDWYCDNYIKIMVSKWVEFDRPLMLGLNKTIYYHVNAKRYCELLHYGHSSAMSMVVAGKKYFDFGKENNPFVDLYLWKKYKGLLFHLDKNINLGIKHGIGLSGGAAHDANWKGYKHEDLSGDYLKNIVGENDYNFYCSL